MEQLKTALEKLAAWLASQRTQTTAIAVVVLLVALFNIFAPMLQLDELDINEEDVAASIQAILQAANGLIGSILSLLGIIVMLRGWTKSVHTDPPTLKEDWHVRKSK